MKPFWTKIRRRDLIICLLGIFVTQTFPIGILILRAREIQELGDSLKASKIATTCPSSNESYYLCFRRLAEPILSRPHLDSFTVNTLLATGAVAVLKDKEREDKPEERTLNLIDMQIAFNERLRAKPLPSRFSLFVTDMVERLARREHFIKSHELIAKMLSSDKLSRDPASENAERIKSLRERLEALRASEGSL